jgi:DNA repair protein RecO (recombination protein O)
MDWIDRGYVLSARKHGENALIVGLLTVEHGRHAGLVRGGAGRRARGLYQPGNLVRATWRARLPEHLGSYSCEMERAHAATLMQDKLPLLALASATALLDRALPERAPFLDLFTGFGALIMALGQPGWETAYVIWERDLLAELGFGLDLESCAATGDTEQLIWVSPKTGRAVSQGAGEPWRDRLLPLPAFLLPDAGQGTGAPAEIVEGLRLTGHFLSTHVMGGAPDALPAARAQLIEGLTRN